MRLLRFLFESDYPPWPLQVFWKCLCLSMSALLIYVGLTTTALTTFETSFMCVLGALFIVLGLVTKLGNG